MELSVAGPLVFVGLLILGYFLGAPVVVGLFAALPFGSTAIVGLSSLGGSSPMVFTAFVLVLLVSVTLRRGFANDLGVLFATCRTAWLVTALIVYSVASAIIFPRLFAGRTMALVTTPGAGVREAPLGPVGGNITQSGYFVIGSLAFFAFSILLKDSRYMDAVRRGLLAWLIIHVAMGVLDLAGKMTGAGDIMGPLRTASYAWLVDVEEAGFWRIAGGYPEASAFASWSLACLAYSFTNWRITQSVTSLVLTALLLILLIFSTSSTAYVGLAIIAPFGVVAIAISGLRGRSIYQILFLVGLVWAMLIAGLAMILINDSLLDPLINLIDKMVLNKAGSASGQERAYWNLVSIQAFLDTGGVGIGMGSSRSSSWLVSVFSQLGVIGGLMMMTLVGVLVWDMVARKPAHQDVHVVAVASGARAAALVQLVATAISGGRSADPGLLFFIALAIVLAYRSGQPARAYQARSRAFPRARVPA